MDIIKLIKVGRVEDAYTLARYMYSVGNPLISDQTYDKLHQFCLNNNLAKEYTERTYDDDPIPYDLLKEFNLEAVVPVNNKEREDLYNYLDEEKSLSIEPVTDFEEAFKYFNSVRGNDLIFMIKVDGIFTKKLIKEREFKVGTSRGRTGRSFDLTDSLYNILPRFFNNIDKNKEIKIYSEAFVETNSLDYLRGKYDPQGFKTEKSSAISMLRVPKDPEDYRHVRVLSFGAEGLSDTISGTLDKLVELGFEVVPHIKVTTGEVPISFSEFSEWLQNMLDRMWILGQGIPSDGIVVDVDNLDYQADIKNQYSSKNIALKTSHWAFSYYTAEVEEIIVEQKRVKDSYRIRITPVTAKDRTQARIINGFNPSILIKNNINVGSKIFFERNSGAVNILLHGTKLEKLNLEEGG